MLKSRSSCWGVLNRSASYTGGSGVEGDVRVGVILNTDWTITSVAAWVVSNSGSSLGRRGCLEVFGSFHLIFSHTQTNCRCTHVSLKRVPVDTRVTDLLKGVNLRSALVLLYPKMTYLEAVRLTPCHTVDNCTSAKSSTSSNGLGSIIGRRLGYGLVLPVEPGLSVSTAS